MNKIKAIITSIACIAMFAVNLVTVLYYIPKINQVESEVAINDNTNEIYEEYEYNHFDSSKYTTKYLDLVSFYLIYNDDIKYTVNLDVLLDDFANVDGHISSIHGETAYDYSDTVVNYLAEPAHEVISNDFIVYECADFGAYKIAESANNDNMLKYIYDSSILSKYDIPIRDSYDEVKVTSNMYEYFDYTVYPISDLFELDTNWDGINQYRFNNPSNKKIENSYMSWNDVVSIIYNCHEVDNQYYYEVSYVDVNNNTLTIRYVLDQISDAPHVKSKTTGVLP